MYISDKSFFFYILFFLSCQAVYICVLNPWSLLALANNLHYIIKNNNIIASTKNLTLRL